jgi:hypothetical protein
MLKMLRQSPPEEDYNQIGTNIEEVEEEEEEDKNSNPLVRLTLGKLRGVKLESRGGREYFGFYNVPYAQPPLGDLRFMVSN